MHNPGDARMHITSVTRLRLNTMYCTTDWNEQHRRMQDNSWLMTLPFDLDYTGCHMPHIQRKDISSDSKIMTSMITLFFLIIFHSHRCFQTYIYFLQDFLRHVINTTTIKSFTEISLQLPWRLQNTGWWHVNMPFWMLLSPPFNFRQKTSTQLP